MDASTIVQRIIAQAENPYGVLSLSPLGIQVTPTTALMDARRCYVRLAALIHPDKCDDKRATEAFQCLVAAFEAVANPDSVSKPPPPPPPAAEKPSKKKPTSDAEKAKAKKMKDAEATAPTGASKPAKSKTPAASQTSAPTQQQRKTPKRAAESDEETTSESESGSSDSEGDALLIGSSTNTSRAATQQSDAVAAQVSQEERRRQLAAQRQQKVADLKARNANCYRTKIGCPKCPDVWQPDDNRLYTLFMSFGTKIHCQACLFTFGCVTAKHFCPFCAKPFDYDASMYHKQNPCPNCKKAFGFMFYPVSDELLASVKQKAKEEAEAARKQKEREKRAAGNSSFNTSTASSGGRAGEPDLELLIGQCIVDEQCPICKKKVMSKHRSHIVACQANPPSQPRKTRVAKVRIVDDDGKVVKEANSPRQKKHVVPKIAAGPTAPKPAPKKSAGEKKQILATAAPASATAVVAKGTKAADKPSKKKTSAAQKKDSSRRKGSKKESKPTRKRKREDSDEDEDSDDSDSDDDDDDDDDSGSDDDSSDTGSASSSSGGDDDDDSDSD